MDAAQRRKLVKRSTKREFKESPLLNLYILIFVVLISIFEMLEWTTPLSFIKPINALLMCLYIVTKLPSTRSVYIITKGLYVLNSLKQLILVFHEEESPTKLFFYLTISVQQIFNAILLNEKFCVMSTSIIEKIIIYGSSIGLLSLEGFLVHQIYPYIRINESQWLFLIAILIALPPFFSLLRYRYTTSRSFWFCLIANLLISVSLNAHCYQDMFGESLILVNTMISTFSQLGHFLLMHGVVLHFMFRKALLE